MSFPYYWTTAHKFRWFWWQCLFPFMAVIVAPSLVCLPVGVMLGPVVLVICWLVLFALCGRWLARSRIIDRRIGQIHDDAARDMRND